MPQRVDGAVRPPIKQWRAFAENYGMGGEPHSWSTRLPARPEGDLAAPPPPPPPPAPPRSTWQVVRPWISVAVVLFVLVMSRLPKGGNAEAPGWMAGSPIAMIGVVDQERRPTLRRAETDKPLGLPALAPADPGPFAFIATQSGSHAPVAYDPCRPIYYVVNERTAPAGGDALLRDAFKKVSDVTGLQFSYEGTTDEIVSAERPPFQPARYGDRWAPVLVSWTDPAEMPALAAEIAGVAGSTAVPTGLRGPAVYVSGLVALDGPQMASIINRSYTGRLQARAVIVHELAHLVGLDHVKDQSQLMNGVGGTVDLQSGDLAGLAQLGAGRCIDQL